MRPIDLAREHGLSTQAVRNYEDDGILPPADRTAAGYRRYTSLHATALRAFLALRPGFGHRTATEIMRAAHAGAGDPLFRLVDQAHADLLRERRTLAEVTAALDALTASGEPPDAMPGGDLSIGALSHRLGLHQATLRKWEKAGILRPSRDRTTGHRRYPPEAVRDAWIAHHLRRGGYPLVPIAAFVAQVRDAGGVAAVHDVLDVWRTRVHDRSRAMLTGAGRLDDYLELLG